MNVKKEKLIIVVFIVLVVILSLFVLYKNNIFDNDSSYKMVKILDYYENKYNGNATHIVETEKYYIFEHKVDNSIRTFLYDKSGNDVTKSVLGVDNIDYISYTDDGYNYVVRTVDNKYGLFDKDFNELININDLVIQETGNKNYFIIGNKYDLQGWNVIDNVGVYDKNGKLVIPREYETIRYASSYFDIDKVWFYAKKDGKYGIIDNENKVIIPFEYDRFDSKVSIGLGEIFDSNNKDYFILYKNGKYGMVDINNKTIIDFDKNTLFYNKYANVVIEKIYDNYKVIKLNVYNLNGELKKEFELNNKMNANFDAYYYKVGHINLVLYDDSFIYVLNKDLELEKYIRPASTGYGMNTELYLSGDKIYLKGNDEKYKIYKSSDNSLLDDNEYSLLINNYITDIKGFTLCNNTTKLCGIIGYDGNNILDFNYNSGSYDLLHKKNELINFEYDENKKKYDIKKYNYTGNCIDDNKNYFIRDNIIKVDNTIYNMNCELITNDVTNFVVLSDSLIITEKFEDNTHNTHKIYNINTLKLADIKNEDNAIITNTPIGKTVNGDPIVVTNMGTYKIVINN